MNMSANGLDILDQVSKAKTAGSGEYFANPGSYRVRVDRLLWKPDAYNGPSFIAETTILKADETTNEKLRYNAQTKEIEGYEVHPHKVGEKRSMVSVIKKKDDPAMGNILQFLCALTGLPKTFVAEKDDPEGKYKAGDEVFTFTGASILELCKDDQPMKGAEVDVVVFDKVQKNDKTKVFTNLKWTHVDAPEAPTPDQGEPAKAA